MINSTSENTVFTNEEKKLFQSRLIQLYPPTIQLLEKTLKKYFLFNCCFVFLIIVELLYFCFQLTFLVQAFAVALHLAILFATVFSYAALRLYLSAYKKEKLQKLKKNFVMRCQKSLASLQPQPEYYTLAAEACCQLASQIHGMEYVIYPLPVGLKILQSLLSKISCWCHWDDVHFFKEMLLKACIDQYIQFVRAFPTDLEAHAGLANSYVMLSGLYVDPRTFEESHEDHWILAKKYDETFQHKFRLIAQKAIEEFKILSDYAPNDPWVHVQLAYSYHDLQMPQDEIREYETILQICPQDKEVLYKLGQLYFEQGQNAKGLQVYEALKKSNYKKAEDLIHFYGA